MKSYRRVLTIAGSDSGGGAGIQADLKSFAALGCYGMSVITALTAQNTVGVTAIHNLPAAFIAEQLDAVLSDIGVDAVKIGMLQSAEIIEVVADKLASAGIKQIVLDPVMVAKSGDKLLRDDAIAALRSRLLPLALLVTPNLPEAEVLCGVEVRQPDEMAGAAELLLGMGPRAVLIKGGHLDDDVSDDYLGVSLADGSVDHRWYKESRIETANSHGTGCTLSAAIAAFLAHGKGLEESVGAAKAYLTRALREGAAYQIGHGHGPVHHFAEIWQ